MARTVVTVVDYAASNLDSVARALTRVGATVSVSQDPEQVRSAERLLLPGVGAFSAAMAALQQRQLDQAVQQFARRGRPLLGICLGMQLLAELGEEGEATSSGLGLIPGRVVLIRGQVKVPHVGWNQVMPPPDRGPLFTGLPDKPWFYFVHSYCLQASAGACKQATVEYGTPLTAAVWRESVCGVQFHPEKSGAAGRQLLQNFLDWRG